MSEQASRKAIILQLVVTLLTVLPHAFWMPVWVPVLALGTVVSRLMILNGRWSAPRWPVKTLLVLLTLLLLLVQIGFREGMQTTVSLLTIGLCLKQLETQRQRDMLVLLYVALFVQACSFLFYSEIYVAFYIFGVMLLTLVALMALFRPVGAPKRRAGYGLILRMMLTGLPLMVLLFMLFPRLGPFWHLPGAQKVAQTGLSDSLSLGDVNQLMQSQELAFRAQFEGDPPPRAERYWRSLVYERFDGRTWRKSRAQYNDDLPKPLATAQQYQYSVLFEPSARHFLVALDWPVASDSRRFRITSLGTIQSMRSADSRMSYQLTSAPEVNFNQQGLSVQERQRNLQLPETGNPLSRRFARQLWQQSNQDVSTYLLNLLSDIRREFTYTLSPGAAHSNDEIDQFWFESKRGFCGHFAGALTFMLRAAGVPARMVAGYQGGDWNPYQRYIEVRQYDAHAWVEYFVEGQGWQRVDPTAAVAPERIEQGAERSYQQLPEFSESRGGLLNLTRSSQLLLELQQRFDAINFAWSRWVLNYHQQQRNLLQGLFGRDQIIMIIAAVLGSLSLIFIVMIVLPRLKSVGKVDPVKREIDRLILDLQRQQVSKQAGETISHLLRRVPDELMPQADSQQLALMIERYFYNEQSQLKSELTAKLLHYRAQVRKSRYLKLG